jgi:hypothetical protein
MPSCLRGRSLFTIYEEMMKNRVSPNTFKYAHLPLLAALVLFSSHSAAVQEKDKVDWSRGIVIAFGSSEITLNSRGRPQDNSNGAAISLNRSRMEAYQRARNEAVEKIVTLLREIRIDPDNMLMDFLEREVVTQERLARIIRSRVKISKYPVDFHTSGCRAILKIGDILPAIPYRYPADEFPARIDNPLSTDYTSLIVDARGLDVEPMILPSVFNEDGLEVYGRHLVDIHRHSRFGIAAYAFTDDQATRNRRAGRRPFYTVALKDVKGCPVISDRDVRKLYSSQRTLERLRACNVIFIIDRKKIKP